MSKNENSTREQEHIKWFADTLIRYFSNWPVFETRGPATFEAYWQAIGWRTKEQMTEVLDRAFREGRDFPPSASVLWKMANDSWPKDKK